MAKPRLVVFDLDYTLWPFWVDTHVYPPFTLDKDGKVYDRNNEVKHYRDVPEIFKRLQMDGIQIGFASRTSSIKDAETLVGLFGWDRIASYMEIYPGSKIPHFKRFREKSGIDYNQMLFFDDEHRNITDITKLGVTCILAHSGMSLDVFQEGLNTFAKEKISKPS